MGFIFPIHLLTTVYLSTRRTKLVVSYVWSRCYFVVVECFLTCFSFSHLLIVPNVFHTMLVLRVNVNDPNTTTLVKPFDEQSKMFSTCTRVSSTLR